MWAWVLIGILAAGIVAAVVYFLIKKSRLSKPFGDSHGYVAIYVYKLVFDHLFLEHEVLRIAIRCYISFQTYFISFQQAMSRKLIYGTLASLSEIVNCGGTLYFV